MINKIFNDIRHNIYLYVIIIAVCVIASLALSFVIDEGTFVGKTSIYNSNGSEVVNIVVNTEDEETNKAILNELTNQAITEIYNELGTSVNKNSTVTKKVDFGRSALRGLIIGLVVCIITSFKVLLPKKKIKSEEEISEIFDGAPIIAKFSGKINEGNK